MDTDTLDPAALDEAQERRSVEELWEALLEGSGRALAELQRRGVPVPTVDREPAWL